MTQETIAFTQAQQDMPETKPWPTVAKAWVSANGEGISLTIGHKVKKDGNLVDTFESLHLLPEQRLYLQKNNKKREGKKDPDYFVKLVPEEDAKA